VLTIDHAGTTIKQRLLYNIVTVFMSYPVNKGLDTMSLFFNILFSDNLVISVQWEEFLKTRFIRKLSLVRTAMKRGS
jgi:hypothetical protein